MIGQILLHYVQSDNKVHFDQFRNQTLNLPLKEWHAVELLLEERTFASV